MLVASSWAMVLLPVSAHFLQTQRAILSHAGQYDADGVAPASCATERNKTSTEGLCRFTARTRVQLADVAGTVPNQLQMLVAGRDVRVTAQYLLAVLRLAHAQLTA